MSFLTNNHLTTKVGKLFIAVISYIHTTYHIIQSQPFWPLWTSVLIRSIGVITSPHRQRLRTQKWVRQKCGMFNQEETFRPDWCVLVGWASSHRPKSRRFESQSGHRPWFTGQVPSWGHARGNWSIFFSLPSPLSKNNKIFFKKGQLRSLQLKD